MVTGDTSVIDLGEKAVRELLHYGVPGMKWGVRNDRGHEGERVKTKKLAKLDKKWEKDNTGMKGYIKAHNAMADRMNGKMIDDFNNESRWNNPDGSRIDFTKPENAKKLEEYESAFFELSDRVFREEMVKLGSNPSGTKKFQLEKDADGNEYIVLKDVGQAKHAEGDSSPAFRIARDGLGFIAGVTVSELELKHYGVKGMKWGVRKDDRTSRGGADKGPTAVVVSQKKPGTYAKAKGGKRYPISDDAKAALEGRQKARASTTDALSNAELRKVVERMNLEQQYNRLAFESDRRSRGQKFVQGLLGKKRYGAEKRRYSDFNEEAGDQVAQALRSQLAKETAAVAGAAVVRKAARAAAS